jgi:hypothetical protein
MDWLAPVLGVFAVLVIALWIWNVIAVRIYRSRLASGYLDLESAGEALSHPEEVRELLAEFGGCGFEPLTSHLTRNDKLVVLHHNESVGSIGEIVDFTDFSGVEGFTTEVTSILEHGGGVLATGNTAMPSIHGGELRQTFPGAPPGELVKHHEAAIQLLREQGLGIRPVSTDEAVLSRQEWFDLQREQIRTAPTRAVLDWIRDARHGYPRSAGPIASSETMRARLDAILEHG